MVMSIIASVFSFAIIFHTIGGIIADVHDQYCERYIEQWIDGYYDHDGRYIDGYMTGDYKYNNCYVSIEQHKVALLCCISKQL